MPQCVRMTSIYDEYNESKYLFGDDLPKRMRDAKETSKMGQQIFHAIQSKNNQPFHYNKTAKPNWRQAVKTSTPDLRRIFTREGSPSNSERIGRHKHPPGNNYEIRNNKIFRK